MLMLLNVLRNRLVLTVLGLLLVGFGGYWAGRRSNSTPVSVPIETVHTVTQTETVYKDRIITVTKKPDGTEITQTEEHAGTTTTNTNNSTTKPTPPPPKPKYAVSVSAHKYDWSQLRPEAYSFEVARRLGQSDWWATAGYRHGPRPEVTVGIRMEFN